MDIHTLKRRWFDPLGRAEGYGRGRWGALTIESLKAGRQELDAELKTWGVACFCLGAGIAIARALIGDDYGYDRFGDSPRGGPHDQVVTVCVALLVVTYAARRCFLRAAFYSRVEEYRRSLDELPEPERTAKLDDYYRRSS